MRFNFRGLLQVILAFAIIAALLGLAVPRAYAAGTITGTVFQDYNDNGASDTTTTVNNNGAGVVGVAVDSGIGGVVVTAYAPTGAVAGATASCSAVNVPGAWCTGLNNGFYQLTVIGAGPYRVEFTNLPAGYEPAAQGANDFSTVQFVGDPAGGTVANVDLGIHRPIDYCQNNPDLATSCFKFGDQLANNNPVFQSFPYSSGSDGAAVPPYDQPLAHPISIQANQMGTTWGIGWQRTGGTNGYLYAASFMKKHSGFGPGGPGAIYRIDRATSALTTYVNLNTVYAGNPAGTDPHNPANYDSDFFNVTWDAVGKLSYGGMAASDDDTRLYVMNLANRTLYSIPLNAAPTAANIGTSAVPLNPPNCPAGDIPDVDVRPFAVSFYHGVLYVGLVCSAESTQNPNDLRAYVYTVNPTTLAFSAAPVLNIPLNYPRRCFGLATDPACEVTYPADWLPWRTTFAIIADAGNFGDYPQPILSDIAFDSGGNMILGLRDRAGDQFGNGTQENPASPVTMYTVLPAGDIVRACGNPVIGWTLENNATCGGLTTGGANDTQGAGNGEYYFQDNFQFHDDIGVGGLAQVPGFPDVANTVFDPIPIFPGDGTTTFDGGLQWYNNAAGARTKGYRLFDGNNGAGQGFGKANGLGDLVVLCDEAPVEIGNRVWLDPDQDGVQDPGEAAIPGVTVRLYDPGGNLLATAVTDANGDYYFSSNASRPSTASAVYGVAGLTFNTAAFTVRLDVPANYAAGGPLFGYTLTVANANSGANSDMRDSDGVVVAGFPRHTFDTGSAGMNNHTYDFGFFNGPTPTPTPTNSNTPVATTPGPGTTPGAPASNSSSTPAAFLATFTPTLTPTRTPLPPRVIPGAGIGPGRPELIGLILIGLVMLILPLRLWRTVRKR